MVSLDCHANEDDGAPLSVAALCVQRSSVYYSLPGVDCYDERRDVRTFKGGLPVVAHPPCRTWLVRCAHQAKAPEGEKELGPLCVEYLRRNGGVLEHPAHSRLFDFCDLPKPGEFPRDGFFSIEVLQAWWGMNQTKRTWLLFSGVEWSSLVIPWRPHDRRGDFRRWKLKSKRQRSATPPEFAAWLVEIARAAAPQDSRLDQSARPVEDCETTAAGG